VGVKKNKQKKKPSNTRINQKLQWKKKHNLSLSRPQSLSLSLFSTQLLFSFFWRNFAKFRPEKYDFDLYKGFFMKTIVQIHQISKGKKNPNRQIFLISSPIAKNIEGFCFFFFFF
jgi:hypothetical protein